MLSSVVVLALLVGQAAGADAPKTKPERKICRSYDTTGSIMGGTKVCHTKAEWTAIDQRNGDNVSAQRDLNGQGGNGSSRY